MRRATSSFLNPPHPSTFQREPYSTPSQHWHPPPTAEHLQLGNQRLPCPAVHPRITLTTRSYLNGSILIATLQPSFTILHTLTTPRAPSPLAGLAWHGSSSKQKSEMLAAQTADGDLRVWSVPKAAHGGDAPCVIRVLNQKEQREPGPCWFAWSKNGRIIQYTEGYVLEYIGAHGVQANHRLCQANLCLGRTHKESVLRVCTHIGWCSCYLQLWPYCDAFHHRTQLQHSAV